MLSSRRKSRSERRKLETTSLRGDRCSFTKHFGGRQTQSFNFHFDVGRQSYKVLVWQSHTYVRHIHSFILSNRILWATVDSRKDMVQSGIVGSVWNLFHAQCVKTQILSKTNVSKRSEIFTGLLKCIGYFTVKPTSQCIEQVRFISSIAPFFICS